MSNPYSPEITETDAKERGLFDCFGKKEEKAKEEVNMAEPEKLQRSNSSSSSSSEEEVEEDGVKIKRKKNKGLKDKIKEKLPGHKDEGAAALPESDHTSNHHHQAADVNAEGLHAEEKKGFLEKMLEKLPGNHKDDAVAPAAVPAPPQPPAAADCCGSNGQCAGSQEHQEEKKGFLEKIKDKLPGGYKEGDETKKDH